MNKETYIRHCEELSGLVRPSRGGGREEWRAWQLEHQRTDPGCVVCRKRRQTKRRNRDARIRNQLLSELCGTSARAAREDMGL